MSAQRKQPWLPLFASLVVMQPALAQSGGAEAIFERLKGNATWSMLMPDDAPGSISASSMLGIDGQSTSTVENVRDVIVALKGLNSNGNKASLGIAFTPARSALAPMDLSTYASGFGWRLLGTTTFGYAQGDTEIQGKRFERRAISIEASAFFRDNDDPILAVSNRIAADAEVAKGLAPSARADMVCASIFDSAMPYGSAAKRQTVRGRRRPCCDP